MKCREVSERLASEELCGLGWWRRLGLRLHFMVCRPCRRYRDQLCAVATAARQLASDVEPLSAAAKERIVKGCCRGSCRQRDP